MIILIVINYAVSQLILIIFQKTLQIESDLPYKLLIVPYRIS